MHDYSLLPYEALPRGNAIRSLTSGERETVLRRKREQLTFLHNERERLGRKVLQISKTLRNMPDELKRVQADIKGLEAEVLTESSDEEWLSSTSKK